MSKSYFRYERTFDDTWIPVLYATRPPATRAEDADRKSPIREVDAGTSLLDCQTLHAAPAK